MPKPTNAVELVKKAAVEAVDASKPVHILFGTVISASPLKIRLTKRPFTQKKCWCWPGMSRIMKWI